MYVCMYIHSYNSVDTCIISMCMHIHIRTHMYMYVYIYIYV